MREEIKAELDMLFKQRYNIAQERRKDPRVTEFETHLMFLTEFASVQERVIRPMMDIFGRYLESLGHRYFIGSAQELIEGHLNPTSKISMHILVNVNSERQARVAPSFSFRIDANNSIYLYKNTGLSTPSISAVGHYDLHALTKEIVESHLKEFIIEAMLHD